MKYHGILGGNICVYPLTCSKYISSMGNYLHPIREPDLASVCVIFSPGEQALPLGRTVALFRTSTDDELSHAVGRDFEYHVVYVQVVFASFMGLLFPLQVKVVKLFYSVARAYCCS